MAIPIKEWPSGVEKAQTSSHWRYCACLTRHLNIALFATRGTNYFCECNGRGKGWAEEVDLDNSIESIKWELWVEFQRLWNKIGHEMGIEIYE